MGHSKLEQTKSNTTIAATVGAGKTKKVKIDIDMDQSDFQNETDVRVAEVIFSSGIRWSDPNTNNCLRKIFSFKARNTQHPILRQQF